MKLTIFCKMYKYIIWHEICCHNINYYFLYINPISSLHINLVLFINSNIDLTVFSLLCIELNNGDDLIYCFWCPLNLLSAFGMRISILLCMLLITIFERLYINAVQYLLSPLQTRRNCLKQCCLCVQCSGCTRPLQFISRCGPFFKSYFLQVESWSPQIGTGNEICLSLPRWGVR